MRTCARQRTHSKRSQPTPLATRATRDELRDQQGLASRPAYSEKNVMSIYVIDDHPLMRDAIVMVLRRLRPAETIVELERLDKLASAVKQHGEPGLFCLDLKLPDV